MPTFVAGNETSLRHRVVRRLVRDEHPAPRGDDGREVGAGATQPGEELGAMPVPVAHLQVVAVAALCQVALSGEVRWQKDGGKLKFKLHSLRTRIHSRKEMEIGDGGDVQLGYIQNDLLAVGGQDAPFAGVPLILRKMSYEQKSSCHLEILTSLNFLDGSDPGEEV